jgi:hypothetical protein
MKGARVAASSKREDTYTKRKRGKALVKGLLMK